MGRFLKRLFSRKAQSTGLSLDDFAIFLETSHWTAPVEPRPTRARLPQLLPSLQGIKAVIWDVYGTLLYCHHDGRSQRFLEEEAHAGIAFDRTVEYFRMWPALSRSRLSPGQYLWGHFRELAGQVLVEKNVHGNAHPEVKLEQVWLRLLARLRKGGYAYDAGMVGPEPAFAQKIALFCDESWERTALFPGALEALQTLTDRGIKQGLASDGQVYTGSQLVKALVRAGGPRALSAFFDPFLVAFSYEVSVQRPDPALYRTLARRLRERGIHPSEALVVGNDTRDDVAVPASVGFKTALFAGDAEAVRQHEDTPFETVRPTAILTELNQIGEVVA